MARLYPDPDDMKRLQRLDIPGLMGMPEPYGAGQVAASAALAEALDDIWSEDEGLYGFLRLMDAVFVMADFAHGMVARALDNSPAPLACKPGCNHCCRRDIALLPTEAVYLALSLADQARSVPEAKDGLCPFNDDEGRCGIHVWRPLACRLWTSRALAACMAVSGPQGYDPTRGEGVPSAPAFLLLHLSIVAAFEALMKKRGLASGRLSLRGGLAALAAAPDVAEGWLSGGAMAGLDAEGETGGFVAKVQAAAFAQS